MFRIGQSSCILGFTSRAFSEHQLDLYEIFVCWETHGTRSFRNTAGDVLTSVETLGASGFVLLCQDPKDANLISVLQPAAPECNLSAASQSHALATCARPKWHGAFARRLIRKKTTDLNHSYEKICGNDDDDNDGNNDTNDDHDDDDDDDDNEDEDDDDDDYDVYDAADLQYRLKS